MSADRNWQEFPQSKPKKAGWYIVRLIADDGDGRVDDWEGVDLWNGTEFPHYRSGVAYFSQRRFASQREAREQL